MLVKEAKKITDSLTGTSKMPGKSYSLPAWECQTGSKLWDNPTSPCFYCYAKKNNYVRYPAIKAAQYRRLAAIDNPLWVEAMIVQIQKMKFFRWHDAGDVQSKEHMNKILEVARRTPNTKHWLPTQERPYLPAPEDVPDNMVIRLSAAKIDGSFGKAWSHGSSVVTDGTETCPSGKQGNQCLDCRACWNKDVKNVSYGKHQKGLMNHYWKHPTHYKKVSDKRKKIHEEWIKDQGEAKPQAASHKLAASSHKLQAATKCRRTK